MNKLDKRLLREIIKVVLGLIFVLLWIRCIVTLTILDRYPSENRQIELRLFWTIREAWTYKNASYWFFIIGNIIGFVPLGFVTPLFFKNMRSYCKVGLVGFLISLLIETTQLIFRLGLFELDDLFHNTLGTIIGYCIYVIFMCFWRKSGTTKSERISAIVIILITFVFCGISIILGQPLLEAIVELWYWKMVE